MTLYEQIQEALNFIESQLGKKTSQKAAAKSAGLSSRGFQDYFWMLCGLTYKEYVRKRKLCTALEVLKESDLGILHLALELGYKNHESFSRAFKKEYGLSPQIYRKGTLKLTGLEKIILYKDRYMGIVIKELSDMQAVCFDAYRPEPEQKARLLMETWLKAHPSKQKRRVFGHNIDALGNLESVNPNTGYRFYVILAPREELQADENIFTLKGGKFAVTGIEGNFSSDPSGAWIAEGWDRMKNLLEGKKYRPKIDSRWFEEELEPQEAGNLRLDLYLELDENY